MMKDTAISYDLAHHPHHHQQSQQQQQQQQHSWNHQRQPQLQTHTTSIYSNHQHLHQGSQPSSQARQTQQQQNQQHDAQVGQYSHQLQSAVAAAAVHSNTAAYYQAAHLYPTYQAQQEQQQQQQTVSDLHAHHHHHHHHHGTSVSTTNTVATSALNAAVVAAAQQQHAAGGNQASALNHHTGWTPAGVATLPSAAHHGAVVTDHSTLAYMTHGYQSHGTSLVNDHHRNSTGPLGNQPIGSAAPASTYTVDTLYNTPAAAAAAAAAVAAYGYNNYNAAAFFQTSNNGHHAQAGHPSSAGLSFWNQTTQHQQQQRTTHSQTLSNQAANSLQRQQQLEQTANSYLHDPRLYSYGRPPYAQNTGQNAGLLQQQADMQHQQQHQQQQAPQQHHRMSANLSQQQQHIVQQQPQNYSQQPISHLGQTAPTISQQSSNATPNTQTGGQHPEIDSIKLQSTHRVSPQNSQAQKQQSDSELTKNKLDFEHLTTNQVPSHQKAPLASQHHPTKSSDETDSRITAQANSDQQQSSILASSATNSISPINKSQSVMKSEPQSAHFQARKGSLSSPQQAAQGTRNVYRVPQEDRIKSQAVDASSKKYISGESKETRATGESATIKSVQSSTMPHRQAETNNDPPPSLEDNMAGLSLGSRKTTWASIASQPAKVSQPKSLKSKIAGSNSVLSSANKHLTTSVTIDSSSLDSKNGINPAIKSSVSTAATSMPRGNAPPPISKVAAAAVASLKLGLLGEDSMDSKISWPAVNASINLTLEDTLPPKLTNSNDEQTTQSNNGDRYRRDDYKVRDSRDHNHNQGPNAKFANSYSNRDERRQDDWHRREYRTRRDSDKRGDDLDKRPHKSLDQHEDLRDHLNARRDFKSSNRSGSNNFRQDEPPHRDRDFKRGGTMPERSDHRSNDSFRYQPPVREHQRDMPHHGNQAFNNNNRHQVENAPHHHYSNLRDGNHARNQTSGKLDLNVHPHLNPDNFNPKDFDCEPENARYFIIKSYSEDDIHRSIKYSVWCSTNHGNKRLDEAYRQQQARKGQLFLFFSVNGSGHFCGMAQMTSSVDFESSSGIWAQSKWQGEFNVKWIYVKDVPNGSLRHITLENNEDKPVTNSRDTQEVPSEKGKAVLKIIHSYPHKTSLFDDFLHYERRQEEEKAKKSSAHMDLHPAGPPPPLRENEVSRERSGGGRFGRPYMNSRPHNDFPNRDRSSRY